MSFISKEHLILFQLFTDSVPKTCENFKALCTGELGKSKETDYALHYKNSMLHRIVRNGWIQGGGNHNTKVEKQCFISNHK